MTFDALMQRFSPDNRLTFPQYVNLVARFQDRHGVSSFRAMKMVEDVLAERQENLNAIAVREGRQPYQPPKR